MRGLPWPFTLALLGSLFTHLVLVFGDTLWAWWQRERLDDAPAVRATTRTLRAQQLDEAGTILAGVAPADHLTIRFGQPRAAAAHPTSPVETKSQLEAKHARHVARKPRASVSAPLSPSVAPTASAEPLTSAAPPPPADTPPTVPWQPPSEHPPSSSSAATTVTATRPLLDGPFPARIDIGYVVKGLVTAEHRFEREGTRYRIETRARFAGNAFAQLSEGEIGPHGLQPQRFVEYRNNLPTPRFVVDFDWAARTVRFGEPGKQDSAALSEGAQDLFSAVYQFALQGSRLENFDMQVVSSRRSYSLHFTLKGETTLTLSGEKVQALLIASEYQGRRFEFFLAPDWYNLPVRIRIEDKDRSLDLVAQSITADGKVLLARRVGPQRDR